MQPRRIETNMLFKDAAQDFIELHDRAMEKRSRHRQQWRNTLAGLRPLEPRQRPFPRLTER